jgi:hypothetical protein
VVAPRSNPFLAKWLCWASRGIEGQSRWRCDAFAPKPVALRCLCPCPLPSALCSLAGIKPRLNIQTGEEEPWELKDLRKTCATYYDEHVPKSSIEILGHSVGGIAYRHYAHRAPLAFRAIMTLPQPSAFSANLRGGDSECPCCRRRFADAG